MRLGKRRRRRMADKLYIVTGTSRGLGAAIAERLLAPDTVLLCISRHVNAALADKAKTTEAPLEQWPRDLANAAPVAEQLETWLGARDPVRFARVALINN